MNIAVAMSGGVDSSYVLSYLKEKGHNIIGITMKLIEGKTNDNNIRDAKMVCNQLNIEHYVLDIIDYFKKHIINYFVEEYQEARTPNPCLLCNPRIKFGILKEYAETLGYDYIATGHYANVIQKENKLILKKAKDKTKDQSYFLSRIPIKILKYCVFPLGNFYKEQVKKLVKEKKLPVAHRKESQEICFIPDDDYRKFLRKYINNEIIEGNIEDENGNILGKHKGLAYYTIGQRRGLHIATGKPVYVRELLPDENKIIVGEKKKSLKFTAINTNWLYSYEEIKDKQLGVKIRYRGKTLPCNIKMDNENKITVSFTEPVSSVTPGQGAVFYLDDIVIASSIINKVI